MTFRSRAFWFGCAVPLAVIPFNIIAYFGIGGLTYLLLTLAQYRLFWWPLHPARLTAQSPGLTAR